VSFGRFCGTVIASLAVAVPLPAQDLSVSAAAGHARYADSISGTSGTVGVRLRLRSPTLWAALEAHHARFTSGTWASQAATGILAVRPLSRATALGVRADASVNHLEGGLWSGVASGGALAATSWQQWILSVEATAGMVRRVDETSDPVIAGAARLSRVMPRWTLGAELAGTYSDTARFADATLHAGYRDGLLTATALSGVRCGDLGGPPWIQGRIEWQVMPTAALELAIGTYPEDLTGFTEGLFFSAGIRIGTAASAPTALTDRSTRVDPLPGGSVRVSFAVPEASSVDIAGEWNQWTPVPLTRVASRRWEAVLRLVPGAYRFSLIVDGERWVVPADVPELPDGFGGSVGLLVIG